MCGVVWYGVYQPRAMMHRWSLVSARLQWGLRGDGVASSGEKHLRSGNRTKSGVTVHTPGPPRLRLGTSWQRSFVALGAQLPKRQFLTLSLLHHFCISIESRLHRSSLHAFSPTPFNIHSSPATSTPCPLTLSFTLRPPQHCPIWRTTL